MSSPARPLVCFFVWCSCLEIAHAKSDMQIASEYVARKQSQALSLQLRSEASRSVSASLELDRFFYTQGQKWRVAVSFPTLEKKSRLSIFEFTVIQVQDDRVVVEIVRQDTHQISKLVLNKERRVVELTGSIIGGIDLFPLRLPSFDENSASIVTQPPLLGAEFSQVRAIQFHDAIQFNGEDGLGRPIKLIWKKRDPWPLYVSGDAGTAVLLKESL